MAKFFKITGKWPIWQPWIRGYKIKICSPLL